MAVTQSIPWWKEAVFYQIYPASFKDSNGDGVGDLPGITSSLDYLKGLGVDAIWVCPMYDSPQIDMGYDIANYEKVYPPYGDLDDMQALIEGCHTRGMKIVLDLVVNHTSDQHDWFKESRSSKDNPKRDWYIWRPARYSEDGTRHPPTNWRSVFQGSVWEWDEKTQEYYLHLYTPEQPDLNWENFETRQAIFKSAMEFWLSKGVDGFRVDTVNLYSKPSVFVDAEIVDPLSEWQLASHLYSNGPRLDEYISEVNAILEKYNAVSIGEMPFTHDLNNVIKYVSAKKKLLNMVFLFDVMDVGMGPNKYSTTPRNWVLSQIKTAIHTTQKILVGTDAWTTVYMENHDQARSISRFGSDATPELRKKSGKMLAIMLATLSGTLFIYEGQEIGMINAPPTWEITDYKDVDTQHYYQYVKDTTNNDPEELRKARAALQHLARDHGRLPIQWNDTKNAGFTTSDSPWMKVHDDYANINIQKDLSDPDSILRFWQKILRLRKQYSHLTTFGMYEVINHDDENLYIYKKTSGSSTLLIVLNFTSESQAFDEQAWKVSSHNIIISNGTSDPHQLQAFDGRVYLL